MTNLEKNDSEPEVEQEKENNEEEVEAEETEPQEVEEVEDDRDKRIEELEADLANAKKEKRQVKRALNKKSEVSSDLSSEDIFALVEAKTSKEDIQEVVKYSKLLGKSIADSLEDPTVQAILKTKSEYRATAKATNETSARASSKNVSTEEILEKASKGDFPEKGSPEAEKLFRARRALDN